MADSALARVEPPAAATRDVALTVSRPALLDAAGSDRRFRELVHNLLAFASRLQGIRDAFGAYVGLTGIQYSILISIAHLRVGAGVGVTRVAQHLGLSGAFVTTETKKLERKGLVSKAVNPADRRRVLLTVTDAGRALLRELAPAQRRTNDTLFQCLSAEDFDRLLKLSTGMVQGAEEAEFLAAHLRATAPRRQLPGGPER